MPEEPCKWKDKNVVTMGSNYDITDELSKAKRWRLPPQIRSQGELCLSFFISNFVECYACGLISTMNNETNNDKCDEEQFPSEPFFH